MHGILRNLLPIDKKPRPLYSMIDFLLKDEHEHHGDDIKDFAKKDPKDMDEQELRFYMFKQHDFDNDDRLDGIELLKNVMKHYAQYEKP